MTTQAIIVYRSPAEAAMWEAITSPAMIPIFLGILMFFTAMVLMENIGNRFLNHEHRRILQKVSLWIASAIGFGTVWYYWV